MSAITEQRLAGDTSRRSAVVVLAQLRYGFDRRTAEGLAFLRWLCETGRLDGDGRATD